MKNSYEDIINLPHHTSTTHPRMSAASRAAQFSPFSALTGHDAAVKETARLTDHQLELEESALAVLDRKLRILADHLADHPEVAITYFQPDAKKSGGAYLTVTGMIKRIDDFEGVITLHSGERILFERVMEMDCELFGEL